MFGYGQGLPFIPRTVSTEVLEREARVAAEIAEHRDRFGPNYTLFRNPDSGQFVPLEELDMSIDEWRAALSRNKVESK